MSNLQDPPITTGETKSSVSNETAPASKNLTPTEPFDPVRLQVQVTNDPENLLIGRFDAEVNQEGLKLLPYMGQPYVIKPGLEVKYLGDNRIAVTLPVPQKPETSRTVHCKIFRGNSNQNLLALDVVAFLNGDLHRMNAADYAIPFYHYLPILLPLGIMAMVFSINKFEDQFMTWGAVGTALVMAVGIFFIVRHEKTKLFVRMLAGVLISALGYFAFGYLLGVVQLPNFMGEEIKDQNAGWRPLVYQEYQCRIELPAEPVSQPERKVALPENEEMTLISYVAEYPDYHVSYSFAVSELPPLAMKNLLSQKELLQKWMKDDFQEGEIAEYYDDIGHLANRNDDDTWNMGVEIRMRLPNKKLAIRRHFVMRNHLYVMTMVRNEDETRRYLEEQFFYNLIHTGMKPLFDPPMAAGAGGGGGQQGGGDRPRGPIGTPPRNLPDVMRKNLPTAPLPSRTRPSRAGGRGRGPGADRQSLTPTSSLPGSSDSTATKPEGTSEETTEQKATKPENTPPKKESGSETPPSPPETEPARAA